jgi:hypothetical protein
MVVNLGRDHKAEPQPDDDAENTDNDPERSADKKIK